MEGRFQISESSPLLDADYDYGIVKHPFPLNWLMRNWYLGPDFFHAVKIGIVQYVCIHEGKHRRGERSVSNVVVMSDYASLGAPDPEEEREIDNLTIMQTARPDARDRRLSFPQSVRDVVLGSGEIVCF